MDMNLSQIIDRVDEIHRNIDMQNEKFIYAQNYINEIADVLQQLRTVVLKVDNIYHICNNKYKSKFHMHKSNNLNMNIKNNDWTYLNRIINDKTPKNNLTGDISVKIKQVNKISEIPNSPIYWVKDINQFAFHINGVILRGNIGNIYNKNHIKKNKNTHQINICKYGNKCRTLLNDQICKFYHDPLQLLELLNDNQISTQLFDKYKNLTRNFINTSWIYTDRPSNNANNTMRHFGSRNTLKYEFELMKLENNKNTEIQTDNFRQQCMHDILVIMGLNQFNLLHEYPELNLRKEYIDLANPFTTLYEE